MEHTADWAMRVWAEDLPALFAEAARGMNALSGVALAANPRVSRAFEHDGTDSETLLVAFLSELIYAREQENLGIDDFRVALQPGHINARMEGAPLVSVEKPIKAVTFHNLKIIQSEHGYETEIVFDV